MRRGRIAANIAKLPELLGLHDDLNTASNRDRLHAMGDERRSAAARSTRLASPLAAPKSIASRGCRRLSDEIACR
jgi:hypothetical protein